MASPTLSSILAAGTDPLGDITGVATPRLNLHKVYTPPGMLTPYDGDRGAGSLSGGNALNLTAETEEAARALSVPTTVAGEGPEAHPSEDQDARPEGDTTAAKRRVLGDVTLKQLTDGYYYTPDASAYPNPYFLELYLDYEGNSSKPVDAVSLTYISAIKKSAPVALVRSRGMDGSVYQENEGFMQATFILSGRSGDRPVDLIRFQKFRNFLEKYAAESKKNKNAFVRGTDVQLVLYFPFEAEAYLCDVVAFDYSRSASSSPNSFEFQISLVTNGHVANRWKLPEAVEPLKKLISSYDNNHTDPNHPCVKLKDQEKIYRPPDDWPEFTEPETFDTTNPPGCAVKAAGEHTIMKFTGLANLMPYNEAQAAFSNYFYMMMHASDMASAGQVQSGAALQQCGEASYNFRTFWLGYVALDRYARAHPSVPRPPVLPIPTEVYRCTQGKTDAFAIAEDVYGDRSKAPWVIDYNRFLDAYTQSDGSPIDIGTPVYIPRPSGPITMDGDTFGTDLKLVDGDLVPVGTTDIATITGYPCYVQNLMHRMTTTVGNNKVYTRYGLKPQIGFRTTSDVPAELRADVRSQIMADHRTKRIISIDVTERGDKADVAVVVEPIGVQPSRVSFTYNLAG